MIAFVQGQICEKGTDYAVIDVGGVGMNVNLPTRSLERLPGIGASAKVHTYMSVREDAIKLFGFYDKEELDMFRLLITVNKIGPKVALDILSFMSPSELRMAILSDDHKSLAKCPGVGAKTAQRILLDLKDRVDIEKALDSAAYGGVADAHDAGIGENAKEAVAALAALGFSPTQSLQAVSGIEDAKDMSVEELIKAALKTIR